MYVLCVWRVCLGGGVVGFKCGIKFTLYLCAHLHVEVVKRRTHERIHCHCALGISKRKGRLRVKLRPLNAFEPQCLEPLFFPHLFK